MNEDTLDWQDNMNKDALEAARDHDPRQPGKFEGEPRETVYFYHCMLDGIGEDFYPDGPHNGPTTVLDVTPEERQAFSLTEARFAIWTRSDGFVYGQELTPEAYSELETMTETNADDDK